jgi:hypothetical protein
LAECRRRWTTARSTDGRLSLRASPAAGCRGRSGYSTETAAATTAAVAWDRLAYRWPNAGSVMMKPGAGIPSLLLQQFRCRQCPDSDQTLRTPRCTDAAHGIRGETSSQNRRFHGRRPARSCRVLDNQHIIDYYRYKWRRLSPSPTRPVNNPPPIAWEAQSLRAGQTAFR